MSALSVSTMVAPVVEASRRARRLGRPVLMSHTQRLSAVDAQAVFAAARSVGVEAALWQQPSAGFALIGAGCTVALEVRGPGRFRAARDAWQALLANAVLDGDRSAGPALLGGFGFDPARTRTGLWRGFPDARLVLSRHLYRVAPDGCWLTTNLLVDGDTDPGADEDRLCAERELFERDAVGQTSGAPAAHVFDARPAAEWQATVARAMERIRAGELEKVVLARAVRLESERDFAFDVTGALRSLAAVYPRCSVFALSWQGRTFLGATPERLARLERGLLQVDALAGSARRGGAPQEDARLGRALLASGKDRREHAIVVRAVSEALDGICRELAIPAEPALLSLPNVHHLHTPVRARLAAGRSLLDALERLHPTPAVGGWPTEQAVDFIRRYEELDRGWYAAPVGWLDQHGEGEFAVALRSALVEGANATLFAGCGIVADSDPEQEYAETVIKLRPMLSALTGAAR